MWNKLVDAQEHPKKKNLVRRIVVFVVIVAAVCSAVPSKTVMHRQPGGAADSPALSPEERLIEDSISSDSRMTVGPVPVWTTARSAAAPVAKSGKVKAS